MAQTADVTEPAHRRETPKIGGRAVVLGASIEASDLAGIAERARGITYLPPGV